MAWVGGGVHFGRGLDTEEKEVSIGEGMSLRGVVYLIPIGVGASTHLSVGISGVDVLYYLQQHWISRVQASSFGDVGERCLPCTPGLDIQTTYLCYLLAFSFWLCSVSNFLL